MYAEMERKGKSARMRQMVHAILRRALSMAIKWGLINRNVCDAVDRPTVAKHEITPLNAEQIAKLIESSKDDRIHALLILAVFSGLREGELFGLEWNDIDMKAANLMVRRTAVDLNGSVTTSPPKTGKGQRLVELPQIAIDALWTHKTRLMSEGLAKCELVFPEIGGEYQRRFGPFRDQFKAILKKAELPTIRFHDLRHSSATLLLSEGVHPKIIQERLGHSTIGITMDTYSHILPSMQRDAVGKLDVMFKKKSG
jgi:integrase